MGKAILKNIKFEYKDGLKYKFSTYLYECDRFDLFVYTKTLFFDFLIFKIFYYKKIYMEENFGYLASYRDIRDYERPISNIIEQYLEKIHKDTLPKQIQDKFKSFDGYLGLSKEQKEEKKRISTINSIIK